MAPIERAEEAPKHVLAACPVGDGFPGVGVDDAHGDYLAFRFPPFEEIYAGTRDHYRHQAIGERPQHSNRDQGCPPRRQGGGLAPAPQPCADDEPGKRHDDCGDEDLAKHLD